MTAMVCCYSAMARELWGIRSIGEMTQRQQESIKSKKKVSFWTSLLKITRIKLRIFAGIYFLYNSL
jgi:hypothetical protein